MLNLATVSIVIQDVDAGIDPAELAAGCAALQRQAQEHIAPAWGATATVRAATADRPPLDGEVVGHARKTPGADQQGELGDHNETAVGTPDFTFFPELAAGDGATWTSVCSHEIAELLADPYLNRCAQGPDGRIWAVEVSDAVEAQSYGVDGILVSNFCMPAWFSPPQDATGIRYDFLGSCTAPFQVLDGGYGQVFDTTKGWQQIGTASKYRQRLAELGLSRGHRRSHAKAVTP